MCIIIGHLLEENRWANESITALLLVGIEKKNVCFFLLGLIYSFYFFIFDLIAGVVCWSSGFADK